jgi:hypothetical protein
MGDKLSFSEYNRLAPNSIKTQELLDSSSCALVANASPAKWRIIQSEYEQSPKWHPIAVSVWSGIQFVMRLYTKGKL